METPSQSQTPCNDLPMFYSAFYFSMSQIPALPNQLWGQTIYHSMECPIHSRPSMSPEVADWCIFHWMTLDMVTIDHPIPHNSSDGRFIKMFSWSSTVPLSMVSTDYPHSAIFLQHALLWCSNPSPVLWRSGGAHVTAYCCRSSGIDRTDHPQVVLYSYIPFHLWSN